MMNNRNRSRDVSSEDQNRSSTKANIISKINVNNYQQYLIKQLMLMIHHLVDFFYLYQKRYQKMNYVMLFKFMEKFKIYTWYEIDEVKKAKVRNTFYKYYLFEADEI